MLEIVFGCNKNRINIQNDSGIWPSYASLFGHPLHMGAHSRRSSSCYYYQGFTGWNNLTYTVNKSNNTKKNFQRKILDAALGFAAGVMTAASYWSLLSPAIELAEQSKIYGAEGEYAFVPVGAGFLMGALFVYGADHLITCLGVHSPNMMLGKKLFPISFKKSSLFPFDYSSIKYNQQP